MAGAVTGLDSILGGLDKAAATYKEALAAALYQKGLQIMARAKRLVPVDTNVLRASGYVAPPPSVDNPVVDLGFHTDYAEAVHERVEVFHEVGQPLYLKRAVDEARVGFKRWISNKARHNKKRNVKLTNVPASQPKAPPGL